MRSQYLGNPCLSYMDRLCQIILVSRENAILLWPFAAEIDFPSLLLSHKSYWTSPGVGEQTNHTVVREQLLHVDVSVIETTASRLRPQDIA